MSETPLTGVFSSDKKEEARQLAKDLLHLFGEGEDQETARPKASKKSMADVADRVLDMVSKSTAQIADTLQKASPEVWKVMVRQQFASAAANLIGPILSLVAVMIITAIGTSVWHVPGYNPQGNADNADNALFYLWHIIFRIVPIGLSIAYTTWLVEQLTISTKKLVNPAYYATRDLLKMLLGRDIPE